MERGNLHVRASVPIGLLRRPAQRVEPEEQPNLCVSNCTVNIQSIQDYYQLIEILILSYCLVIVYNLIFGLWTD